MKPDNGHDIAQDDSAMDYGGQGYTWCARCKALYGTPQWDVKCAAPVLTRQGLRELSRLTRIYRKAAERVGLVVTHWRDEDAETGTHFHGFQADNFAINMIGGKWWPVEGRHYRGNIYEPPSNEWDTIDSAFDSLGDALEWLVHHAHESRLNAALEDEGQYLHYLGNQEGA